ncbi:hypothetical protein D623_10016188 [Myotis brandtii]|uniref:Uncharacterized protein n=1 Tax=Myotis brandtii TaxID=109478 RepID=S7PG33_MYOBR|nr:hypothetical protein D623_10016188 [Myotis brandtii]
MTSFALPYQIIFSVCLYPSTYFPLFITSWSPGLIDSNDFFVFFVATIFLPQVREGPQPDAAAKMAGEQESHLEGLLKLFPARLVLLSG